MASDETYNEQIFTGDDSSYDSDFEGSEDTKHSDVSRTVSDTLGEEFAEYSTNSELVDDKVGYKALVEFGMKLGYTEQLVQTALQKLNPKPYQNELLAELIKLGAMQNMTCSPKLEGQLLLSSHSEEAIEKPIEQKCTTEAIKFRPIVIDGSNVAMSHGNRETFSCRGIKICVDWFRSRGINELTVFVPKWRKESPRLDNPVVEQEILHELEKERLLVFTPSREVRGKRMVCYDDRYILKLASENDGIVVSNDNYRDLVQECPEFRKVVEERILMYTFVNDRFMPPDDPLGRSGPTLDNFLKVRSPRKAEICPYGKKCTYGNKCKYNHPERGVTPHKSVSETLIENAQKQLQVKITDKKLKGKSLSLPLEATCRDEVVSSRKVPLKKALSRAQSTSTFKIEGKECDNTYKERGVHGVDEPYYPCMRPPYVQPLNVWQPPQWSPMYEPKNVNLNQSDNSQRGTANNLHRKLQRQLSINPVCDPRIFQMQRNALPVLSNHRPVSRNYSYQGSVTSNSAAGHLNVTRISSAPSSNQNYSIPPDGSFISSSDPQLSHTLDSQSNNNSNNNNCISYSNLPVWPIASQQSLARTFPPISSADDARRKIHYHLSSIFPIEQVDAVMQLYPNETNAQKICSLILSMFPSKLK